MNHDSRVVTPALDPKLALRPVLIGTRATLATLSAQLGALSPSLRAAGSIVVDTDASPRSLLAGSPILGNLAHLPDAHRVLAFTLAIVSLPASMKPTLLRVRARLRELGIPIREVAPLDEMLASPPAPERRLTPTDVDIVELIGRTPFGLDRRAVARILEGKRVLITGAGGSIGSELARIAATFHPAQLVLMERSENALFEIDRVLARRHPEVPRKAILHDVVDTDATLRHFVALKPDVVFHAAAHKHVPLMEDHPAHAVVNNLFGTKSVADASVAVGVERFVLVSTDKAVNPTSVMGATKRLAEIYTQSLNRAGSRTRACMVRFGNVLGSACSVLPIWAAQLAEGGPITVTDPRMTRYFMTIHEAATLVIQAAAISPGQPGDSAAVFVLDMGEPVRILDLAQRFVRAHGFEPRIQNVGVMQIDVPQPLDQDFPQMEITLTGARPGEKLHEELAYHPENLLPTPYPGIRAWASDIGEGIDVAAMTADLSAVRHVQNKQSVLEAISRYVPMDQQASARGVLAEPRPIATESEYVRVA